MKPEDAMSKEAVYEACKPTPAEQVELDKMAADIQTAIFDLLTSNPKTPHTDEGSEASQRMFKESYQRIYEQLYPNCKIEIEMDETPLSDEDRKARKSKPITVKIYQRYISIDVVFEK